jgi:tRNA threonylcarbamoyladenosine biosynthesis protein TsaB
VLVLAWDTATAVASLALARIAPGRSPEILFEALGDGLKGHSEFLPPMVEQALAKSGARLEDVSLLVCGRGPGSFTGLRTGLALAKGLAFGAGVPALGVGSLDALAAGSGAPAGALVVPLIDARHQEVFAALYRVEEAGSFGAPSARRLSEASAVRPGRLPDLIRSLSPEGEILLTGPGLSLAPAMPPPVALGDPGPPKALALASLGAGIWERGKGLLKPGEAAFPGPSLGCPLDPIYGRSPDIFKSWTPPARLAERKGD